MHLHEAFIDDDIEKCEYVLRLFFKSFSTYSVCRLDVRGVNDEKTQLPRILLLMHQWFISSEDLATIFLELYPCATITMFNVITVLDDFTVP